MAPPQGHCELFGTLARDRPVPGRAAVPISYGKRAAPVGQICRESFDLKRVKVEPGLGSPTQDEADVNETARAKGIFDPLRVKLEPDVGVAEGPDAREVTKSNEVFDLQRTQIESRVRVEETPGSREKLKSNAQATDPVHVKANGVSTRRPVLTGVLDPQDPPHDRDETQLGTGLSGKKQEAWDYFHSIFRAALEEHLVEFTEGNPPGGMDRDVAAELRQQLKCAKAEAMDARAELFRKDKELVQKQNELYQKEKEIAMKDAEIAEVNCELDARVQWQNGLQKETDARTELENEFQKREATPEVDVKSLDHRFGQDEFWMDHVDWKLDVPRMTFEQTAALFGRLIERLQRYNREHVDDVSDECVRPDFAGMLVALHQKMTNATRLEWEQRLLGKEIDELEAEKKKYQVKARKLQRENKFLVAKSEKHLKG